MALNRSDKSRILRRYFPGMTRNSEMSTEPSASRSVSADVWASGGVSLGAGGMVGAVVAWGAALLRPAGATVAVVEARGVAGSVVDSADADGLV